MKNASFVIALLASALLAGACGGKKDNAMAPGAGSGSMEPAMAGSGSAMEGSAAMGSGSAGSGGW